MQMTLSDEADAGVAWMRERMDKGDKQAVMGVVGLRKNESSGKN